MTTSPCIGSCKTGSCREAVGADCIVGMVFRWTVPGLVFIGPFSMTTCPGTHPCKAGSCKAAVGADCFLGMVCSLGCPGACFLKPLAPWRHRSAPNAVKPVAAKKLSVPIAISAQHVRNQFIKQATATTTSDRNINILTKTKLWSFFKFRFYLFLMENNKYYYKKEFL